MATDQPPPNYVQASPGAPQANGMAVAGLVLGILALVLFFTTWPAWVLALLGIIFGALGISKANKIEGKGKGMAIAGLVCAALGLLISIVWTLWIFSQLEQTRQRAIDELEKVRLDTRSQLDRKMPPLPFVAS